MSNIRYTLKAKSIYAEQGELDSHYLTIEDDNFADLHQSTSEQQVFDLGDIQIIPGLIDLHIHGRDGSDVMDGKLSSLATISSSLARHGVTGFLATTVTSSWRETLTALDVVGRAAKQVMPGAQVLGAYSEGLFFTNEHKGAHNERYFLDLSEDRINQLFAASHHQLKILALAPELENACQMTDYISSLGIKVMLGHTNATYDQTVDVLNAGACGGVHVFNGMRGIHHREPGCTGALLTQDSHVEVIADGIHLHPAILKMVTKLKSRDQVHLISDCISAGGMPDGEYTLGKLKVTVREGIAKTPSGSLGGSTLALNDAVMNLHKLAGLDLSEAIHLASLSPARFLGLDDKIGSIAQGKQADFSLVGPDSQVYATFYRGRLIYCNEQFPLSGALKDYIREATRRKTQ